MVRQMSSAIWGWVSADCLGDGFVRIPAPTFGFPQLLVQGNHVVETPFQDGDVDQHIEVRDTFRTASSALFGVSLLPAAAAATPLISSPCRTDPGRRPVSR